MEDFFETFFGESDDPQEKLPKIVHRDTLKYTDDFKIFKVDKNGSRTEE